MREEDRVANTPGTRNMWPRHVTGASPNSNLYPFPTLSNRAVVEHRMYILDTEADKTSLIPPRWRSATVRK